MEQNEAQRVEYGILLLGIGFIRDRTKRHRRRLEFCSIRISWRDAGLFGTKKPDNLSGQFGIPGLRAYRLANETS